MTTRYTHTNIVSRDWKGLAAFYQEVFDCVPVPPERHLSGDWLSRGTGVQNAQAKGMHLRLPGLGENGPTLEIFEYLESEPNLPPAANRRGFGHIAFHVDDVEETARTVIAKGGKAIGEITTREVPDVGVLTFVYMADPEGNVIEIQHWSEPSS